MAGLGAVRFADLVRRLGGDLHAGGRRALVPGPGHGSGDRSVSLLLSEGRVVVHSFAGDDWRAVLDDLRDRGLVDAEGRVADGGGGSLPLTPSRPERLAAAAALWDEARPADGTLAERHVRRRGVTRGLSAALRFHPGVSSAVYAGAGRRRPALLAAIREANGPFCGVEVAYLAADGTASTAGVARKTVGGRPRGAAVRLDPAAGQTLLVGEGVFSCLSASQVLGLPAWALLAVGNLRLWTPPRGVWRVVIAGDRGRTGEEGAGWLADRLRAMGTRAEIRWPPAGCADWNDAVRGPGGGGGAGEGGPEGRIGRPGSEETPR